MYQDIELNYKDQTFVVKEKQFMSLIMTVEMTKLPNDVICDDEERAKPMREHLLESKMGMVSCAYARALKFAGAEGVTHLDVHMWINQDVEKQAEALQKCYMILFDLVIMPNNLKKVSGNGKKKTKTTKKTA